MKHFTSLILAITLIGCGPKVMHDGKYDDPEKVNLLDDRFGESDMQNLSKDTIEKLVTECAVISKAAKPPRLIAEPFKNNTEEHIDMASMMDKIRTAIINSGKAKFIAKEERATLEEEYQYNEGANVEASSKKKRGKQKGADYILRGVLAANVQQAGDKKTVYYKLTTRLTNLETSEIDCVAEKELRKIYYKKRVGL